jgi:RNA polymerase sigma-70 factor, ECF subfamily
MQHVLEEGSKKAMNVQEATLSVERHEAWSLGTETPNDERALVALAKSGRASAFGELYERHRSAVYRTAFRVLRNREDAEDAVQRCFQRVLTNLTRFREDSAFSTWVTRIAINEALMSLRQRRTMANLLESNDEAGMSATVLLADSAPTPEEALAENELRAVLRQAISRLRENLRTVVLLRELHGLSSDETARRLGLTVAAVKARLFHARRYLRRHLGRRVRISRRNFPRGMKKNELATQRIASLVPPENSNLR